MDNYWFGYKMIKMASSLIRNSGKHNQLVAECNCLLLKLPSDDYILHDMGLRVIVQEQQKVNGIKLSGYKTIKIEGLSTDPIDFWDDYKLEKFYSKLSLLLMMIYERKENL